MVDGFATDFTQESDEGAIFGVEYHSPKGQPADPIGLLSDAAVSQAGHAVVFLSSRCRRADRFQSSHSAA